MIDLIRDEDLVLLAKVGPDVDDLKNILFKARIDKFSDFDEELRTWEDLQVFDADVIDYITQVLEIEKKEITDKTINLLVKLNPKVLIVLDPQDKKLGLYILNDDKSDPSESITEIINILLHWVWIKINTY